MLELYYTLFDKCCDVDSFEEPEVNTDFLYLALAHYNFYDYIRPSKKAKLAALREHDCVVYFKADDATSSSIDFVAKNRKSQ